MEILGNYFILFRLLIIFTFIVIGFIISNKYINCYYLELRHNLGISLNDTFGVEIECEEADEVEIKRNLNSSVKGKRIYNTRNGSW